MGTQPRMNDGCYPCPVNKQGFEIAEAALIDAVDLILRAGGSVHCVYGLPVDDRWRTVTTVAGHREMSDIAEVSKFHAEQNTFSMNFNGHHSYARKHNLGNTMNTKADSKGNRRALTDLALAFIVGALFNGWLVISAIIQNNNKGLAAAAICLFICGILAYGLWRRNSATQN